MLEQRRIRGYGWRPDLPDRRDLRFEPPIDLARLPMRVDLRVIDALTPIYDQSQLGSCTANAIAAALRFTLRKQGLPDVNPSRLYIYYKERQIEGDVETDGGAMLRDGLKVVANGFVPEVEWPYDIGTFAVPPRAIELLDQFAARDRVLSYLSIEQELDHLKSCIAAGYPFVGGVSVYDSFEQATSGEIPMPTRDEVLRGGHAIVFVGYDDQTARFTWRNSWGASWGQQGYGTLPYEYIANSGLASDFWSIRLEQETA